MYVGKYILLKGVDVLKLGLLDILTLLLWFGLTSEHILNSLYESWVYGTFLDSINHDQYPIDPRQGTFLTMTSSFVFRPLRQAS